MAFLVNGKVAPRVHAKAGELGNEHAAILAALYLRGLASVEMARHRWPAVLSLLRRECAGLLSAESALRRAGFREEALALGSMGALGRAEHLVASGCVLTPASEGYPSRWRVALGWSAPAALWKRGPMPEGPFVTIVGSRQVPRPVWRFVESTAAKALCMGYAVSSGGAPGCDSAAAMAVVKARWQAFSGTPLVEIWPCGLQTRRTRRPGCVLSLCPPHEVFSSAAAMERNALLYALGEVSLVGQARFREGGTWHGAVEAHRRRIGRLAVRWDPGDPAARALRALGAFPLEAPEDLGAALQYEGSQPRLALAGS